MAMIESGIQSQSRFEGQSERNGQFMYTARLYDLDMTSFGDERYDPYKSCHAAARYLRIHTHFRDWSLQ